MAEGLTGEDVGQVYLDGRDFAGEQGIEHGDRGVGEGARIDNEPGGGHAGLLDPGHELAFVIALAEI